MNFGTFNRTWIEEMRAQRDNIVARGALEKVQSFLAVQRAYKTPILPVPLSFDRDTFERMAAAGRLLISAQDKIMRHLCQAHSRAEVLRMFNVPDPMVPLIGWDELTEGSYNVSRFDVVPSNDGFYFCELNRDSSIGGLEVACCLEVFSDAMGWGLMEGREHPQMSVARLLRRVTAEKGLRRVVILDWSTNRNNGYFGFDLLHQLLQRELPGIEVQLVYETEYQDAWFTPDEARRTLVYRGFLYQDMHDHGAFFNRLMQSGATILNTFSSEIHMSKRWFALFCDQRYRGLLSQDEIAAIERYVPHTVSLTRDNLEQVLRNKEELAFKLSLSTGGKGVLLGAEHTVDELRALLEDKGVEHWMAQKVIVFDGIDMPHSADFEFSRHNVVLGMFMIDGHASGFTVAASSRTKVVNIHSGVAGYTWAVPMTPDEQTRRIADLRSGNTKQ